VSRRLSPCTAIELGLRRAAKAVRDMISAKYSAGLVMGRTPFNLNLGSYDEIKPYLHSGPGGVYEWSSNDDLSDWLACNPQIGRPVVTDFIHWIVDTDRTCDLARWADDGGRHV
jgi:hypothetical protein